MASNSWLASRNLLSTVAGILTEDDARDLESLACRQSERYEEGRAQVLRRQRTCMTANDVTHRPASGAVTPAQVPAVVLFQWTLSWRSAPPAPTLARSSSESVSGGNPSSWNGDSIASPSSTAMDCGVPRGGVGGMAPVAEALPVLLRRCRRLAPTVGVPAMPPTPPVSAEPCDSEEAVRRRRRRDAFSGPGSGEVPGT